MPESFTLCPDPASDLDGNEQNDSLYQCVWTDGKKNYHDGLYGMAGDCVCPVVCLPETEASDDPDSGDEWFSILCDVVCSAFGKNRDGDQWNIFY